MTLSQREIDEAVARAISEDVGNGDVTTDALVPRELQGRGAIVAKADGVLAGMDAAETVFHSIDSSIDFHRTLHDGDRLAAGSSAGTEGGVIAEVSGSLASILMAERTALNFLQHLSGIATATNLYVQAVADYQVEVLDTRKTVPGLRGLEKYAVHLGGGRNHRRNLSDGILIKDNHIAAGRLAGLDINGVVRRVRRSASPTLKIEIEVEDLDQVREAIDAEADILMLDNMTPELMAEAVKIIDGRALTEASGKITISNIRDAAATGVDMISIGAITHSAPALDMSLDVVEIG